MPWYTPWSDHIAKRVCKYLLQRYLGQFLEEKLTLDQLNVDLYKGIGTITDVALDVLALNELAEQQSMPFHFVEGFIEEMSVSIPWASIISDCCDIHVRGLSLTVKYKERDKSKASMFESMMSSMSSSMQLAEDCLRNEKESLAEDASQSFEGIERFAQTIDSILCRIRVKLSKTVIRLEEEALNGCTGVALEATVEHMEYYDVAGEIAPDEEARPELHASAFSTKKFLMDGVSFYFDEFPLGTQDDAPPSMMFLDRELKNLRVNEEEEVEEEVSVPVLLGRLAGRQELSIQFKQDGISGPKIELDLAFGALTAFVSPRQVHKLIEFIEAMSIKSENEPKSKKSKVSQKPMEEEDFKKIEQELLANVTQPTPVFQCLDNRGWSNSSMDDSQDFCPLNNVSRYNESVMSSTTSLASSTSSLGSYKSGTSSQPSCAESRRSHLGANTVDADSAIFHFRVTLSSVAVVLLHDDVLVMPVSGPAGLATPASLREMRRLADDFFAHLGHFSVGGFGVKDFDDAKNVFLNACQRNHVRFLAAPVIIEGSETPSGHSCVVKGSLTAATVELLECLVERQPHSHQPIGEYIELLKFSDTRSETGTSRLDAQPSLKLNFRFSETSRRDKGRKVHQPRCEFSFTLQPLEMELDLTIVDRITSLLNPCPSDAPNRQYSNKGNGLQGMSKLKQVVDNTLTLSARRELKIFCSFIKVNIRFPIPDLRPVHDMDRPPWWRRLVREDVLLLELTDVTMLTAFDTTEPVVKYELQCRDLLAKFQEADLDKAVEFMRVSADPASNTILDGGRGCGWPRLVISFHPENRTLDLDEPEEPPAVFQQSMGHMSLIATLERTKQREVSPFSFQTVIHDSGDKGAGEELVTPASKEEIAEFVEVASANARMHIEISCPTASFLLPSKHFFEVIYNRLTTDLLLWKPSAPVRDTPTTAAMDLSFNVDPSIHPIFNLCSKSGVYYDSDSDSESQDGLFLSVAEQRERHERKQASLEKNEPRRQSRVAVSLTLGQGTLDLFLPVRDSQGNIIPGQNGELVLTLDEGEYFYVSGFKGKKDLDYMCVQLNHFTFYHNGLLADMCNSPELRNVGSPIPHHLLPTVLKMEHGACVNQAMQVGVGSAQSLDMLTAAVKISRDDVARSLKHFRVALGLRNSALRYRVSQSRNYWFNQIIDFFDVDDYPVAGYDPSVVLTQLNLHLWNCNIDYRPLYLPLRTILNFGSFNISSNIAAKTNSSTLRFIAEDASFFLSDKLGHRPQMSSVNLRKDYVCVMELGLFELSLRLCEQSQLNPKVDLRASANTFHLRTCADSAKALTELLTYFAADGDLHDPEEDSESSQSSGPTASAAEEQVLVTTEEAPAHILSQSQVARVNNLMEEAMLESQVVSKGGSKAYFAVDEDELADISEAASQEEEDSSQYLGSELLEEDDSKEDSWESDFCLVENEAGMGILPKSGLPEVRLLTDDPLRLVDNHFALPTTRTDHLRSPRHFPKPVLRYTLREASLVWQMYGGSDFDPAPPPRHVNIETPLASVEAEGVSSNATISYSKGSPMTVRFETPAIPKYSPKLSWKEHGGVGRRHDTLMELQLDKVEFQYEVYPEHTAEASRQVLLVKDLELRDRLATSQINKFLYQYYSEAKPKQSHAHMVMIKAVQMRTDPKVNLQECCLKVSLLPLRLNIDQDSLLFLFQFFSDISGEPKDEGIVEEEVPVSSRNQTPTHAPVMTVTVEKKEPEPVPPPAPPLIELEDPRPLPRTKSNKKRVAPPTAPPSPPAYFRSVIFSPEVPVKLDYQGKHVDLTHGPLAGMLMGLGQLNNSEFKLKRVVHRHGLLGFDKLLQFLLAEWSADVKRNQLPGLLGGVGPMYSLVQLFQGVRDLFWLPIEQYQKDGRLVRGIQRGANSFTTSSAMAVLELTSRLIQIIQATAETAYDMVSPGPSVRVRRSGKGKRRQYPQPADIREGVANAILVVRHGIGETAENIMRVASEEHEQKGVTGAVGGVLRQIPPTVVKPIILATEATNNVIGGVRSQLVPDVRKEAADKWRRQVT